MKRIPVVVFGLGGVGRALVRQIVAGRQVVADRVGARFVVSCVVDSSAWRTASGGLTVDEHGSELGGDKFSDAELGDTELSDTELSDTELLALVSAKEASLPIGEPRPSNDEVIRQCAEENGTGILVDVTATSGMESAMNIALDAGWAAAVANKKALAGPFESSRRYFGNDRVRFESTVGAGQPVIATLRYLLDTNDSIMRMEGQLSGSLGFICKQLDKGTLFSQALSEARASGFTEPDPREDLAGMDVMRKILILGRMAGWEMSEDDVSVESLFPKSMSELSTAEFMDQSSRLDEQMKGRVAEAAASGNVLRYVASVASGKGRVGLQEVPRGSTLANLKYVSFQTERYDDEPLLVGGKGAGVEITAAGVIGDMVGLARERLNKNS